jgi:hypothetical protein
MKNKYIGWKLLLTALIFSFSSFAAGESVKFSFLLENKAILSKKINLYIKLLDKSEGNVKIATEIESEIGSEIKKIQNLIDLDFMNLVTDSDHSKISNSFSNDQKGKVVSILTESVFALSGSHKNLGNNSTLKERLKVIIERLDYMSLFINKLIKDYEL